MVFKFYWDWLCNRFRKKWEDADINKVYTHVDFYHELLNLVHKIPAKEIHDLYRPASNIAVYYKNIDNWGKEVSKAIIKMQDTKLSNTTQLQVKNMTYRDYFTTEDGYSIDYADVLRLVETGLTRLYNTVSTLDDLKRTHYYRHYQELYTDGLAILLQPVKSYY